MSHGPQKRRTHERAVRSFRCLLGFHLWVVFRTAREAGLQVLAEHCIRCGCMRTRRINPATGRVRVGRERRSEIEIRGYQDSGEA